MTIKKKVYNASDLKKMEQDIYKSFEPIKKYFDGKSFTKLGVLGDASARSSKNSKDKPITNAQIGFIHEMGSVVRRIPARSFLRVPLKLKGELIPLAIAKDKAQVEREIIRGNKKYLYAKIGEMAKGISIESFATSGYGTWPPLKKVNWTNPPKDEKNRANRLPLVDTSQLKRSINYQVMLK